MPSRFRIEIDGVFSADAINPYQALGEAIIQARAGGLSALFEKGFKFRITNLEVLQPAEWVDDTLDDRSLIEARYAKAQAQPVARAGIYWRRLMHLWENDPDPDMPGDDIYTLIQCYKRGMAVPPEDLRAMFKKLVEEEEKKT